MDKEEYAELHYLLAKLKYSCAEIMVKGVGCLEFDDMIEKINDVQRILIMDKKDDQTILKGGYDENEK